MRYFLLLLGALLALPACRKDHFTDERPPASWYAVKSVPGQPEVVWEADGWAKYDANHPGLLWLRGVTLDESGCPQEDFYISEVPAAPGMYPLQPGWEQEDGTAGAALSLVSCFQDDLGIPYGVQAIPGNVVEILEVDTVKNTVKGRFNLALVLSALSSANDVPERFVFRNGTFELGISE